MKRSRDLRVPIFAAILAAMSIVLGKYWAINIGDTIRISFESLPVILSSVLLGPLWGAMTGVCADILGSVMKGYSMIPLITVAQGVMGVLPWVLTRLVFRSTSSLAGAASVVISHAVCSVGIKTVALHLAYLTPYTALFAQRVPTYLLVAAAEGYVCWLLLRSKVIRKEFSL